jgi:hypothetical protein
MIAVGFSFSNAEWQPIRGVVRNVWDIDADEIVLENASMDGTRHDMTLRTEIELTASVHLRRDKVMRSLPTQMAFKSRLTGLRDDAERLRNGLVRSRVFRFRLNDYAPDKDMLVATDPYFEKLLRNLNGIIEALGPPHPKMGSAASKNMGRDLFWSDLLAIWCQIGGKATGKGTGKAAAFLRAASVPVFNAMPEEGRDGVPDDPRSVAQWLRRRSPTQR